MSIIDLRIGELFEDGAWLTVLEYEGQLSWLTRDLMMTEGVTATSDDVSMVGNMIYTLLCIAVGAVCASICATLIYLMTRLEKTKK